MNYGGMRYRRDHIESEVALELLSQDKKWGIQKHQPDRWMVILGEETGEACKALLENDFAQYRKEMIQVAAVAVAAIECLDRQSR